MWLSVSPNRGNSSKSEGSRERTVASPAEVHTSMNINSEYQTVLEEVLIFSRIDP